MSRVPTLRLALVLLVGLLLWLQWHVWLDAPTLADARALERELAAQRAENARLRERNAALAAEVQDLKGGGDAVEERARTELGMVKRGETFYQVVRPATDAPARASGGDAPP